ncbi:hypothetical protein QYE76_012761 [Lolium multiflorum]|uniref:Uncharacterized protein n=1 Tax=Lolium multiflorum TaxID=4521 RepID=A0AAD8X6Z8_LOLMU|nr:hypothetical protein QYE76_012761 [Lolium multiflorum]
MGGGVQTIYHIRPWMMDVCYCTLAATQVEDDYQLTSVDEIATAAHHIVEKIQEQEYFSGYHPVYILMKHEYLKDATRQSDTQVTQLIFYTVHVNWLLVSSFTDVVDLP